MWREQDTSSPCRCGAPYCPGGGPSAAKRIALDGYLHAASTSRQAGAWSFTPLTPEFVEAAPLLDTYRSDTPPGDYLIPR